MADQPESAAAWRELLQTLSTKDESFAVGDTALADPASVVDGYLFLQAIFRVAMATFVNCDTLRPSFTPIAGPDVPTMRWGGDNSDSRYRHAPIDPDRTYRVRADVGDAAYASATVYAGPDDGRWSDEIIGTRNTRDHPTADGNLEVMIGPDVDPDTGIRTDPRTLDVVTRDYVNDPTSDRPTRWHIELVDGSDVPPPRLTDDELARRLRRANRFIEDQFAIVPIDISRFPNQVEEPWEVPPVTYGWAAGDAAYAMGGFDLREGEALVLRGRSPECAFWNVCLWNPFLAGFDYRYERTTLNGSQVTYEPDGSWQLVISAQEPTAPTNWLSTAGHASGLVWFRWFLAASKPTSVDAEVVAVAELTS